MTTDSQTNFLYLADTLPEFYPDFYQGFQKLLIDARIHFSLLPKTKDVWCLDYMPVQVTENKFVQFQFAPTYLKPKKYHNYVSDPSLICQQIGLEPVVTDIIADEGNVTRTKDKVIMTNRVIQENPKYSVKQLTEKIRTLLEVDEVILIPSQPDDLTGHSDGMVRFLDERTILLNDYSKEPDREFVRSLKVVLKNTGLDIIEIPTTIFDNEDTNDATGDYINYLQMDGYIFLPIFKRKGDEEAVKLFENLFQEYTIIPVESTQLSKDGGVLNCISWNIKK